MTINDVTEITSSGLYTIISTAAPVLPVSLVIGLVVRLSHTATSIHEQTLTFVPKVIGIFVSLMILGHWMLNNMVEYMANLWADFTIYIK